MPNIMWKFMKHKKIRHLIGITIIMIMIHHVHTNTTCANLYWHLVRTVDGTYIVPKAMTSASTVI